MPSTPSPRLCVLAPAPMLTVTIENGTDHGEPEVHIHPGGQGLWVARMARALGADVVVCGPFGGETGSVAAHLAERENLNLRAVGYAGGNGAYLHDRRDGERRELALMPPRPLDRHELDDLYGVVLVEALDAEVCVVTGAHPTAPLPIEFFARLVGDLRSAGVRVVADVSGPVTHAIAGNGVEVLKMSHEELVADGIAADESIPALREAARGMLADDGRDGGVGAMMVSRAGDPGLLVTNGSVYEVRTPQVTAVDHRGAGDSMTAGIAVGLGRGLGLVEAVRLGAAAGALNVTRRGLGTGRREQIERFAHRVKVRELA